MSEGRKQQQRGPVILRRAQIEPGTTDQRLLDSRGPTDWVHTDPWRVVTIRPLERVFHEKICSSAK